MFWFGNDGRFGGGRGVGVVMVAGMLLFWGL